MVRSLNTTRDNDLVSLYADRVHTRRSYVATVQRVPDIATNGIQTFGRQPITRQRSRSRVSRKAFATLMATALVATSTSAALASSPTHEVQQGETLTGIAEQYGLSVPELLQMNRIDNPDWIFVGQHLSVSGEGLESPTLDEINVGDTVYRIQAGDTLFNIAKIHGVSLENLLTINELNETDIIYAGDYLIIPTATRDTGTTPTTGAKDMIETPDAPDVSESTTPPDASHIVRLHMVATGETLESISGRYGLTLDQLVGANDITPESILQAGQMLRIPDSSWTPPALTPAEDTETATASHMPGATSATLENMPVQQQSLPLSAEAAALSMVTAYWGNQVSEWVFIENLPLHENPHRGFRGDINGQAGGTTDYGVYPKPLSAMLANYGFVGEEFYTMGEPDELRERIDRGEPVLVWMTGQASREDRHYEWYQGERFVLVPNQHVVVAYGYDAENVYVANPANGSYQTYSWTAFSNAWAQFDGMSMAVYPAG